MVILDTEWNPTTGSLTNITGNSNTSIISAPPVNNPENTGYGQGTKEDTYQWLQNIGVHLLNQDEVRINEYLTPTNSKIPFSFLSSNTLSLENLMLLLLMLKMSKTPEGTKELVKLITHHIDANVRIISAIEEAGTAHPVTACLSHMLAAGFMHSRGLLDDAAYMKNQVHITAVFDKTFVKDIISDTMAGVSTLVKAINPTDLAGVYASSK